MVELVREVLLTRGIPYLVFTDRPGVATYSLTNNVFPNSLKYSQAKTVKVKKLNY